MGPVCNTTLTEAKYQTTPIWRGMSFHRLGSVLSAIFALIATVMSLFLIFQHATHYSKPNEQKNIIRIIFMVPIYACVSFLSYVFYQHAIYYEVARDCYEAIAIASFFALLCYYVAPDLHNQKDHFRDLQPREWLWPLNWFKKLCGGDRGIWRRPRSGLTWFNTMGINATAVTIAMYCLIEFYRNLRDDLASHRPFLKLLCIKLVIFLSFWQTLLLSFLTSGSILKPSDKISHSDLKVGIPSMLLCIEMAIFSVMHLFAFSWKEYKTKQDSINSGNEGGYKGGFRAIFDASNLWDLVKASARGFHWLFIGRRKRTADRSYNPAPGGSGHLTEPDTTYHGPAHNGYDKLGSKLDNSQPVPRAEERLELLNNAQLAPVSSMDPDSLSVKNPEPSTIDGFSEPSKQSAVYSAGRQHDHKPAQTPYHLRYQQYSQNQSDGPRHNPYKSTPYPDDNEDAFSVSLPRRFSYDNDPEQLSHPSDASRLSRRQDSPR